MKQLTHRQITFSALGAAALLLAVSATLAYATPFRDPFTVSFKRFYPAVLVGSRVISVNDIEQGQEIAARFGLGAEEAKLQILDDSKADILADRLGVRIPSDAAADELRYYTKGNEAEYRDLLARDFEGSEYLFYKYVIRPQLSDTYLRLRYHSDVAATDPAYARALAVLDRLAKGEKFEDLARTESDDRITGQIGGDLGFYESGQVLPELEDQISVSELGRYREDVIISRLGYHIVYPVEHVIADGKKAWHAKHMLFVPSGYDEWLAGQTEDIRVRTIKDI